MKNIKTLLGGPIVALMLITPAWASPKTVTCDFIPVTGSTSFAASRNCSRAQPEPDFPARKWPSLPDYPPDT